MGGLKCGPIPLRRSPTHKSKFLWKCLFPLTGEGFTLPVWSAKVPTVDRVDPPAGVCGVATVRFFFLSVARSTPHFTRAPPPIKCHARISTRWNPFGMPAWWSHHSYSIHVYIYFLILVRVEQTIKRQHAIGQPFGERHHTVRG